MLRALDDQLAKRLLCATYEKVAVAHVEEELLPDAQAVDAWFEPDPSYAAELAERGLLGRMMPRGIATIFESYSDSPTIVEYRSCVRKQLTLDHLRGKEASKNKEARPEIPWLWMLSAGQPRSVLDGYGFAPIPSLPPGFWQRQPADAVGLVVMRDLPKTRETLLLRLMGGRQLRKEAMAELLLLPKDAWERQVATPPLVALRQIAEQDPDAEAREYMIDTNVLYSQWEQKTLEEGRQEGQLNEARAALRRVLATRKLALSAEQEAQIDACEELPRLERWLEQAVTAAGTEEALR